MAILRDLNKSRSNYCLARLQFGPDYLISNKFNEFSIQYDNTQDKIKDWVRKTKSVTEPLIKGKWRIF